MCLSSELYNDLVMLGDDCGRSIDESVEEGSSFRRLIAGAQSLFQDLVERAGDECQMYIQINAQGHGYW